MAYPDAGELLNKKIILLWLQFKVYDVLDILKNLKGSNENKEKRRKVA
jgi:hypothetical protein